MEAYKRIKWYPLPLLIYFSQLAFSPIGGDSLYYKKPELMYILFCGFIIISMTCFIISEKKTVKLTVINRHYEEQLQYIEEVQGTYKGAASAIHDAKHHLNLLDAYIIEGEIDRAQEYLQTIYDKFDSLFVSYTGNPDVDSIIHSKRLTCGENVSIYVNGGLPAKIDWLDTADLCILLANALSNAIEGCGNYENAVVDIQFVYRDWLVISVENPIGNIPAKNKSGKYKSRKGDGHGYGLFSIEAITKKYAGHMSAEVTGGKFVLELMLQKPKLE